MNTLVYNTGSKHVQPHDFDSVDIAANDLTLTMAVYETSDDWDVLSLSQQWERLPVSFLDRVAASGRLQRLDLSIDTGIEASFDETLDISAALIRVINANPQLAVLHLHPDGGYLNWTPLLQDIFEAMEDHPGLRTFVVSIGTTEPFDYSGI